MSLRIKPYVPMIGEVERRWVQIDDGVYVSPFLARTESGCLVSFVNWNEALELAYDLSHSMNKSFCVASVGEELAAIKFDERAKQENMRLSSWTRNAYITHEEGGRKFTRLYSYLSPRNIIFKNIDGELKNGYIDSLSTIGAPESISKSETPNRDFLDSYLYHGFGNGALRIRRYDKLGIVISGFDLVGEELGFHLAYHKKKELERIGKRLC